MLYPDQIKHIKEKQLWYYSVPRPINLISYNFYSFCGVFRPEEFLVDDKKPQRPSTQLPPTYDEDGEEELRENPNRRPAVEEEEDDNDDSDD